MFESNLSQIVDKLHQSGINIEKAEVADFNMHDQGNTSGQEASKDQSGKNLKQQQSQDRNKTDQKGEASQKSDESEEESVNYFA